MDYKTSKIGPDEVFIRRTIEVWQPYYKRSLTKDDAEEIIRNVGNLLELLERWGREEAEEKAHPRKEIPLPPTPRIRGPRTTCSLKDFYRRRGITLPTGSAGS